MDGRLEFGQTLETSLFICLTKLTMAEVNEEVIDDVNIGDDTNEYVSGYSDSDMETFNRLGIDPDNFTDKDLAKFANRLVGSERANVDYKKKAKAETSPEPTTKYLTEADLERRDFLKANPELSDYTKEIETYSKKGLSLDEAKVLVMNSDKARVNREKLNSLWLSDGESATNTRSTISRKELDNIAGTNQAEYNRIRTGMDSWKIKLV